jgi:hypothetical protein
MEQNDQQVSMESVAIYLGAIGASSYTYLYHGTGNGFYIAPSTGNNMIIGMGNHFWQTTINTAYLYLNGTTQVSFNTPRIQIAQAGFAMTVNSPTTPPGLYSSGIVLFCTQHDSGEYRLGYVRNDGVVRYVRHIDE